MASLPPTTTISSPPTPKTLFADPLCIKSLYPHLPEYLCNFLHHCIHPMLAYPWTIPDDEEDGFLFHCLKGLNCPNPDTPDYFALVAETADLQLSQASTEKVEELKASMDEQFASIRATLATLTTPPPAPLPAKPSAQPPPKPTPPPRAPPKASAPVAKALNPPPLPRPPLPMLLPPASRPSAVCTHLNAALKTAHPQVTLSAARWTKNNNLVVTAGPDTTAHHLTSASTFISDTLSSFLSTSADTPLPVSAKENVRWSRLLINNIPTGVSATRGAYSPQECQDTLARDNPVYRSLQLARLPTWVKHPDGYAAGSSSSLVMTFKDPSGVALQDLLAHGSLFAFRQEGHLRRWKQRPRARASPSNSDGPSKPT
ncbi:hypothetical protein EDB92DRAFT_1954453 [Lactarius akahatsu]|uniref:Uncharacterized protein n=1 Tax=Lactarius akahatsu TaxID=416441 RepID=A0AAD4L7G5_9AGAM|nr:hypothetical protein EDB92DRAFT_1954453 [Lactarius akahatsu]